MKHRRRNKAAVSSSPGGRSVLTGRGSTRPLKKQKTKPVPWYEKYGTYPFAGMDIDYD